jgi:hypothetical protein
MEAYFKIKNRLKSSKQNKSKWNLKQSKNPYFIWSAWHTSIKSKTERDIVWNTTIIGHTHAFECVSQDFARLHEQQVVRWCPTLFVFIAIHFYTMVVEERNTMLLKSLIDVFTPMLLNNWVRFERLPTHVMLMVFSTSSSLGSFCTMKHIVTLTMTIEMLFQKNTSSKKMD